MARAKKVIADEVIVTGTYNTDNEDTTQDPSSNTDPTTDPGNTPIDNVDTGETTDPSDKDTEDSGESSEASLEGCVMTPRRNMIPVYNRPDSRYYINMINVPVRVLSDKIYCDPITSETFIFGEFVRSGMGGLSTGFIKKSDLMGVK